MRFNPPAICAFSVVRRGVVEVSGSDMGVVAPDRAALERRKCKVSDRKKAGNIPTISRPIPLRRETHGVYFAIRKLVKGGVISSATNVALAPIKNTFALYAH